MRDYINLFFMVFPSRRDKCIGNYKFPYDVFDRELEIRQRDSPTRQHLGRVLHVVEMYKCSVIRLLIL